jgi:hypothetical protein
MQKPSTRRPCSSTLPQGDLVDSRKDALVFEKIRSFALLLYVRRVSEPEGKVEDWARERLGVDEVTNPQHLIAASVSCRS